MKLGDQADDTIFQIPGNGTIYRAGTEYSGARSGPEKGMTRKCVSIGRFRMGQFEVFDPGDTQIFFYRISRRVTIPKLTEEDLERLATETAAGAAGTGPKPGTDDLNTIKQILARAKIKYTLEDLGCCGSTLISIEGTNSRFGTDMTFDRDGNLTEMSGYE